MKYNKQYEVMKVLSHIYPRVTVGEASEAIKSGVLIEKYQYKALKETAIKHTLSAIA